MAVVISQGILQLLQILPTTRRRSVTALALPASEDLAIIFCECK
jgi:hypothetical protein